MYRLLPFAAFVALALPALMRWRGYPWQLAFLTALAFGALGYSAWRTFERMRERPRLTDRVKPAAASASTLSPVSRIGKDGPKEREPRREA